MFTVKINYNIYGFATLEEAQAFAKYWNVEFPKQ